MFPSLSNRIKEYFLLGLLTLGPLTLTVWVFFQIFAFIDNIVPAEVKPFAGLGILLFFSIILLAGLLTKTVFGTLFTSLSDSLLSRVPFVKTLYPLIKQVSHALLSGDSQSSFKRVVSISFFSDDCKALAFVTGEIADKNQLVLFVPTAPNPTSGYVVLYDKSKVEDANMSVEKAVKAIVSCGSSLNPKSSIEKNSK